MGVCVCRFCNVWVCVCVGFVMCMYVCGMCGFCNVFVCVGFVMCEWVYVCVYMWVL
jgi:hypothetical protein